MALKFVSERNLKFMVHEVFDTASLNQYGYFKDHNKKMFDMVLKEAIKLAKDLLFPIFEAMDRKQPEMVDGKVKVHPDVEKIMKEFAACGWMTAALPYDQGGDQLPFTITNTARYIFASANYSASAYPGLTSGAARLIQSFGSQELKDTYMEEMYSGNWQGTMALTEPEAGSSLADIQTVAEPTDSGHYLIKGQKTFISAGDHDGAENIVHLMLGKIRDAPSGIAGISLFVVPKKRVGKNGELVLNDVATSGVYHKMGYKGCPIAHLNMGDKDDCRGWLIGKPHCGLVYMFQMMNEARIAVGTGAIAMATGAYYAALDYSKTRFQGRKVGEKDPTLPQIPLIKHADVKRMLLFQRAIIEGSVSLLTQCARYVDLEKVLPDGEEKKKYSLLLELLIPIVKSYPSEMGIHSISQGLQCLGGSGYCDDYPLEQYYRDARIHPIHEGTTGIQGMDLLGRKLFIKKGLAFKLLQTEVATTISQANEWAQLTPYSKKLEIAMEKLNSVSGYLMNIAREKNTEVFLADATLFLELFGIIAVAWQWLLQGIVVQKALRKNPKKADMNFYTGKMFTLQFFFEYELPKIEGLAQRLMSSDALTVNMKEEYFAD